MSPASTRQIRDLGREVILRHPGGIRFNELVREICATLPEAARNTVVAQVANHLIPTFPSEITKPSRGLYKPLSAGIGIEGAEPKAELVPAGFQKEEEVYEPFAEFLKNDLDEATQAVPLGGAGLRGKWATPDVVGVYRPSAAQLIKFSPEIVAAEIKLDARESVVAFGQAIAYRLFASRTYVVMPSALSEEDSSRLEALCLLFGLGFVLFDPARRTAPEFEIRVRAQRFTPDAFFMNDFATRLHALDAEKFEQLFG